MTQDSIFRTGDLIVGSSDPRKSVYSETGAKLANNGVKIYGSQEDIEAQQEEILSYVSKSGGKRMTSTSSLEKKQVKRKKAKPTQSQYVEEKETVSYDNIESATKPAETVMYTIQFENDFGKIKSKIESYDEQDMAIMLVFPDEDSVLFEPRVGEALKLYLPQQSAQDVYYPGVTFNSPDSSKKLMILFKIPAE